MDREHKKTIEKQYRDRCRNALDTHKQMVIAMRHQELEIEQLQERLDRFRYCEKWSDEELEYAIELISNR